MFNKLLVISAGAFAAMVRAAHPLEGKQCQVDSDCMEGGFEICLIEDGQDAGVCQHKKLFPLLEWELQGMFAVFVFLWFANVGGVSGGGIVVPICIMFFKFDPKDAIALSNFSICLASILRYLLMSQKPHPLKNGKGLLVDQNLAVIMLPMIISGVSFGVILNIVMSEIIISSLYTSTLLFLNIGLFRKGLNLYKMETAVKERLKARALTKMVEQRIQKIELAKQPSSAEDAENMHEGGLPEVPTLELV